MPKQLDHTKLLCDISELNSLFEDSSSLEAFLQRIVEMIAKHMQSQVCSIYLYYDESQELVLTATYGLHLSSVGKVKMKLGEGLTGLALKELRPICEGSGSSNPNFKYFPGIGEEKFDSFLAVPIIRGHTKIGAMVIQNIKKNYFEQDDIHVLKAITSQLANTIEVAKILMTFNRSQSKNLVTKKAVELKLIKGRVGSEGYAWAESAVLGKNDFWTAFTQRQFARYSLEDFHRAVQATEKQLEDLQREIEERLSDVASLIFTAQILMLKDKGFMDAIVEKIKEGDNPPLAIISVVKNYVAMFQQLSNAYVREKGQDVEDIGKRLLENLTGNREGHSDLEGKIVVARELFPSNILQLSSQGVKGVILLSGGVSSHLCILARSLEIPLVIADQEELLNITPGTPILLDAEQGNIYVSPSREVRASFKEQEEARARLRESADTLREKTHTADGVRIKLLANINLLSDLKAARGLKSEGIGLYRTEFPFIVRSNFPSEEEQYVIYKKLVEGMPDKEIVFRTLDIGGDKVLSYYSFEKEENPFLGMRSIRFSLRHQDIFAAQIRAILRAGFNADVKMMFPMVSSLDEFIAARDVARACLRELKQEDVKHKANISLGMMVELPSVLEIIDDLAQEADFLCIGTNDFIQYMLAVDRTNEKVADLYLAHHPSILRALKKIVAAGRKFQKEVTVCGDMAEDPRYIPYLIGIGLRRFSLNPRNIPKVKLLMEKIDVVSAEKITVKLLAQKRLSEISRLVEQNG